LKIVLTNVYSPLATDLKQRNCEFRKGKAIERKTKGSRTTKEKTDSITKQSEPSEHNQRGILDYKSGGRSPTQEQHTPSL